MQLNHHNFLITGGASGLGAACARRFAAAGARVMVLDISEPAWLPEFGSADNIRYLQADVTSEADISGAIAEAEGGFGALHGVVNCAGIALAMKLLGRNGVHSVDAFSLALNVNLVGTFNVMRLAADVMQTNTPNEHGERGVIINTASVAAFEGQIGQIAYAASKGGVVAMTLPASRELARHGIRVVTIAPGIFDTQMLAGLPEEARRSLGGQTPFPPRLGDPDEYAQLAEQIVANPMLNGATIRLDGALRMAAR